MKIRIGFVAVCFSVLFLSDAYGTGQSLGLADLEYYKVQNAMFAKELELVFDNGKPAYHSSERKSALYLADAITHYPSPHDDCIKDLFLSRYKKALSEASVSPIISSFPARHALPQRGSLRDSSGAVKVNLQTLENIVEAFF